MKNLVFNFSFFLTIFFFQNVVFISTTKAQNVKITESKIVWKGYKVSGSHEGTMDLKSGSLSFEDNELTGGSFVIDMTSIACTDLSGEYARKLEGHLKSDDFFGVEKYPESSLRIIKAKSTGKNSYKVKADLSIKGITKSVKFDVSIYGKKATASIKIDRTDFNVRYGSGSFFDGLKDNMIYDEFDLVIDLEF